MMRKEYPENLTQTEDETPLTLDQTKALAADIKYTNPPTTIHKSAFIVFFSVGGSVNWSAEDPAYIFLRFRRHYESEFREHLAEFLAYSETGDIMEIGDYCILRAHD